MSNAANAIRKHSNDNEQEGWQGWEEDWKRIIKCGREGSATALEIRAGGTAGRQGNNNAITMSLRRA